ncbi:MAG: hypothetical protein GC189_10510 [Alphaproteobacteria bacterium]|nr:hypothetical protein [Alphaproteobacteria bacterium]
MFGIDRITLAPTLSAPWLIALAFAAVAFLAVYVWRGGEAPISRAIGLGFIFLGLLQPMWVREARVAAPDAALVLIDQSESLEAAGRTQAARRAGEAIAQRLSQEENLTVRVREIRGGADGTPVFAAIQDGLADIERNRIAGAIVVTDGQAVDAPENPSELAPLGPVHGVIIGDPARGDRRIELIAAPAFGIVGEDAVIEARVDDPSRGARVALTISIDGQVERRVEAIVGEVTRIAVRTPKRGPNMVVIEAAAGRQEISLANNRAAFQLAGVRDRLRVLLITGEPHAGARVWRNLLKSDPTVDLVHFTILRPPEKLDLTPQEEMTLIPFPTEALFGARLNEFDLIIFDRYQQQGILGAEVFANLARRVRAGGALLIAAGEWDATGASLYNTPLATILPARPTGTVIREPFRPALTDLGRRHPVTRTLPNPEAWGRWTRQIEANAQGGEIVLSGARGRPLLTLSRAGRGRVAEIWSDQAWLWARGYEGGGPHGELLRRLAHWLMQEPELEEERLTLNANAGRLIVERASVGQSVEDAILIAPDGRQTAVAMTQAAPGLWRGQADANDQGLYEARSGSLRAFAAIGPLNPREVSALDATADIVRPAFEASGGTVVFAGEDGQALPSLRRVERGARAHGEDWIGVRRNGSAVARASASAPLGPGWAWAAAGLILLMLGWRREAR